MIMMIIPKGKKTVCILTFSIVIKHVDLTLLHCLNSAQTGHNIKFRNADGLLFTSRLVSGVKILHMYFIFV